MCIFQSAKIPLDRLPAKSLYATMTFRNIILILFGAAFCCCEEALPTKTHLHPRYSGIYIDHGSMTGIWYSDRSGNIYNYRSVTSTITNDSTLPLHLDLSLPAKQYYPAPYSEQYYHIYIIPEAISGEHIKNESKALKEFLDSASSLNYTFRKIIPPKKELTLTIGVLSSSKSLTPGQMALMSKEHKPHFVAHDSLITHAISEAKVLDLLFGIDFYKPANTIHIIPCGKMWFTKQ